MASVVNEQGLFDAVDEAFAITGRGLAPGPTHIPTEGHAREYCGCRIPKWRIVGARRCLWSPFERPVSRRWNAQAPIRWEAPPHRGVRRSASCRTSSVGSR